MASEAKIGDAISEWFYLEAEIGIKALARFEVLCRNKWSHRSD